MDLVCVFPLEQLEMSNACGQRVLVINNKILPPLMGKQFRYGCCHMKKRSPIFLMGAKCKIALTSADIA